MFVYDVTLTPEDIKEHIGFDGLNIGIKLINATIEENGHLKITISDECNEDN